jgi:hypothetical protein
MAASTTGRGISVEGELAHHQDRPGGLSDGEVHRAVSISHDSEMPELAGQLASGGRIVALRNTYQHHEPWSDGSQDLATRADLRSRDSLYHCPHRKAP